MQLTMPLLGLMLIVVSYLWVHVLGRIADPAWHFGRDDVRFLGWVTGVYFAIVGVIWLIGC